MNYLSLIQIINLLDYHQCSEKYLKHEYVEATPENIAQAKAFAYQILEKNPEELKIKD